MRYLGSLLIIACSASAPAYAGAHCFCKLGPLSAPVHNFGEIEHWATQNHDGACRDSCNTKTDAYMRNANNRAAACNALHNASVVAYYAVGTKSYQAGGTYNCPRTGPTPTPGTLVFRGKTYSHYIQVNNGLLINPWAPPILPVQVQNATAFVKFTLHDSLSGHAQSWTYDAYLYRDNALVEQLTGKSGPFYSGDVVAAFTGQPNSFVHGHDWKIAWHYAAPQSTNGSASFHIQ
jgi:hypothetical protein